MQGPTIMLVMMVDHDGWSLVTRRQAPAVSILIVKYP
jgi:hypothetical protein